MWITRLQLSDFKSYGPDSPAIEFRQGVNLIQGHNGAGKSTLLEAIGLALFDSKPYNLGQFVREGARSGKITVGFVSAVDEREYEIVRGVGTSSVIYAYDPETQRKVCEGKEDTSAFIREHLQAEPGTDLTTLFEDAIGVPQGTMTAIFRETPRIRKEKFNRLLRIDEYENAWHALNETRRHIGELAAENEREQAGLRGALSELPEVEREVAELSEAITAAEAQKQESRTSYEVLGERVAAADALKAKLDGLGDQLARFEFEVASLEKEKSAAESAVQESQMAVQVVAETLEGFRLYEGAQERARALEAERDARDALRMKRGEYDTQYQLAVQALARIDDEIKTMLQADAQVKELTPQAEKQQQLEETLFAQQQHKQTLLQLEARLKDLSTDLEALQMRREVVDTASALHAAADESSKLVPDLLEEQIPAASHDAVVNFERALERCEGASAQMAAVRAEYKSMQANVESRGILEQELAALQVEIDALREREAAILIERGTVAHEQEQLNTYDELLGAADAICPVCQRPMDTHAHQEAQAHYTRERSQLHERLSTLDHNLLDIQQQAAMHTESAQALTAQIRELPTAASLAAVSSRMEQAAATVADRLAELLQAQQVCHAVLVLFDEYLAGMEAERARLQDITAGISAVEAQLLQLGDPRRELQRARDQAENLEARREEYAEKSQELADLEQLIAQMDGELAAYADLDAQALEVRQVVDQNEPAYRRYLSYVKVSEELTGRTQKCEAAAAALADVHKRVEFLRAERLDVSREYDADEHTRLHAEHEQLDRELVRLEERIDASMRTLAGRQRRLDSLRQIAVEIGEAEQQAKHIQTRQQAFDFLRGAIRQAGPQITRQMVRMVTEQANHIFGDILGDHSLILNWSEDYAISLNVRGEERDFELLSGGEQMVAAMAVRLALLTQLTNVQFAFFDEPTTNLDDARRHQLAERLGHIQSLRQLFVISHDDTFEQESYHVIQIRKEDGLSQVELL